MMGETLKGLTTAIVALLFGIFVTGRLGTTELEFKTGTKEGYFNIPQQVKNDLILEHQGKQISNISVVDIAIFNRVKDIGPLTVYFKVTPKEKSAPKLISVNVIPPDSLPNIGVAREQTTASDLIAFKFSIIKAQRGNEFYLVRFIYEGEVTPVILPTTSDKDIALVSYKEWKDNMAIILWVTLAYAVLFVGVWAIDSKMSKKRRERLTQEYQTILVQRHKHINTEGVPMVDLMQAVDCYREFSAPKPGILSKIFKPASKAAADQPVTIKP